MSINIAPRAGGPAVNMNGGNAAQVFDLLGIHYDGDFGELPAEDFLGRVLLAQALLDVHTDDRSGRPEVQDGRWIDCGRRPGYLAETLELLHMIASWALERHTVVEWS